MQEDVVFIKIEDLKPHPKNAQIYENPNREDLDALAESLKQNGFLEPITILSDNTILSGHRRTSAAKIAGIEIIPARIRDVKSQDAQVEMLLEFNRQRRKTPSDIWRESQELKAIMANKGIKGRTSNIVAEAVGLNSGRQLERIDFIMRHGPDYIKEKLNKGELTVGGAYDETKKMQELPDEKRSAVQQKIETGAAENYKDAIKQVKAEENKALEVKMKEDNVEGDEVSFSVILIHPEWDKSELGFNNNGPDSDDEEFNQFQNSEQLSNLTYNGFPICDILMPDGFIYLTCPGLFLELAFDVMRSWGASPVSVNFMATGKENKSVPQMYREFGLFVLVGSADGSFQKTDLKNWFYHDLKFYNELPDLFYRMIEDAAPGPRLQIYGRASQRAIENNWFQHNTIEVKK